MGVVSYNSPKGRAYQDRLYNIRHRGTRTLSAMLVKVLQTVRREFAEESLRRVNESKKLWAISERLDKQNTRRWQTAFYCKIYQPRICIDCSRVFETLYPHDLLKNKTSGTQRCLDCRKSRRLAIHGGGPLRRCRRFGVSYDRISFRIVFLRDRWICQICGVQTLESNRGTFKDSAPEVDHIWPLSLVVDGVKSPGHVLSNCQTACRKCNIDKGAKGQQ